MARPAFTLHANANSHDGYVSLRVTFDEYDDEGFPGEPVTWRRPVQVLWFDTPAENALHLLSMLHAMVLSESSGTPTRVQLEQPLPGL